MPTQTPQKLAQKLLGILHEDREERLLRFDDYLHGRHDDPYMPPKADDEYRLLAKRAVSNWFPLLVGTPAQALYVDGFRRSAKRRASEAPDAQISDQQLPEWDHWERSKLSARQHAIHRGAFTYGHSFTITERDAQGNVVTKGLSALKTAAVYVDPANDDIPYAALTITTWPSTENKTRGQARMWDDTFEYAVTFTSLGDLKGVTVVRIKGHTAPECPVTRFAAQVDLEGRTTGLVGPMIELQNRINQTVFDLLVAQTYGSFKVRYATGMAPPIERDDNGDPVLDEDGNPKPLPINHNARRFLFAEDAETKFGSLDETPLDGYINSIDMSIRHLAAISQTPPHHLLGQIANLSAEALMAAETALQRKVEEFRKAFGESWERVFRLAAALGDDATSADDFHGEVLWRDMESRSLAQAADALGKLKDQLGIPARGLWRRVPNVTEPEIAEWELLTEEQDAPGTLASAVQRATANTTGAPASFGTPDAPAA